jgi:arylsulfatase A-like enzyme
MATLMHHPLAPLLLAALTACSPDQAPEPERVNRPNVLLIVVDTLRADRVSSYGYGRETTPVLDALAAQGVLAEDVTAQASWTMPSMVSMFQGRYVTSYRDVFFEDTPTLAETFQRAGYHTLGIVGNGLLSKKAGFDRGFDHYEARSKREGSHPAREAAELIGDATAPLELATERGPDDEHAPFFAYLHLMDPHGPYKAHPEWEEQLPVGRGADRWNLQTQRLRYGATHPGAVVPDEIWREMAEAMARYDQEVYTCDVYIGIVLDYLERRGALENTIVAVVSDHGEGLWDHVSPAEALNPAAAPRDHFFRPHGKVLYEELVRTPMILKGPGIPAGRRIDSPAENVDLFPTLLQLCDLAMPDGLHGQSLVPAMHGEETGREHVFSSVDMFCSSVRSPGATTDWKLIVPTEHYPARKIELFDIRTDPSELQNLAAARPEVVARLRATLNAWAKAHPTQTNLGQKKDPQTMADLKALGYADGEEGQSD